MLRRALAALLAAVFFNAVGFRALTASVAWPGVKGAPVCLTAAVRTHGAARTVPARKLRRRRHHAGQFAVPQETVRPASFLLDSVRPVPDGDSADSRAPNAVTHPPA